MQRRHQKSLICINPNLKRLNKESGKKVNYPRQRSALAESDCRLAGTEGGGLRPRVKNDIMIYYEQIYE